jgi:hypothetical protein
MVAKVVMPKAAHLPDRADMVLNKEVSPVVEASLPTPSKVSYIPRQPLWIGLSEVHTQVTRRKAATRRVATHREATSKEASPLKEVIKAASTNSVVSQVIKRMGRTLNHVYSSSQRADRTFAHFMLSLFLPLLYFFYDAIFRLFLLCDALIHTSR